MKKIKFTLLTLSIFLIASCSSDDTSGTNSGNLFVEWKLTKILVAEANKELTHCEKGEGVIFTENAKAKYIIVDEEGFDDNIIQEGFEECDYRYADYDLHVDENNEFLYLIVPMEGEIYGVDDYIAQFEIITLSSSSLTLKLTAETSKGKLADFELNKVEVADNEKETYFYDKK